MNTMKNDANEIEAAVNVLSTMVTFLESTAVGLSFEELHWKPTPFEFSLVEHVCHLRDLEREGFGIRIERMLCEENPVLPDFDGTAIALARDYNSADFPVVLDEFRAARVANVARLASLNASERARSGTQDGVGRLNLGDIPAKMHEHDDVHRTEILQLREQLFAIEF